MSEIPIKVLLVDDHPLLRAGLKAELQADPRLDVCGEAANARQAKDNVISLSPDVVALDLMLGDEDGLTLIRELRQLSPSVRIVVLSMLDPSVYQSRAIAAGADAFVHKSAGAAATIENLIRAGHASASSPPAFKTASQRSAVDVLSDRELQVFRLIGLGRTTREISTALGISPKTVDAHKEHIKLRIGLGNAAQLTTEAARWVAQQKG